MNETVDVKIDKRKFKKGITDCALSAEAIDLVYISNNKPGYSRKLNGKKFRYFDGGKIIKDQAIIDRIKKLVLPPAWDDVWICKQSNGHLQATGIDKAGRKQYKYHPRWDFVRNQTKFYRLFDFGKNLPTIRKKINSNLQIPGYSKEKVLSALLAIMDKTSIRVGNSSYEKLYGSFGLTTLKNRHVNINGSKVNFSFVGKKGVKQNVTLRSKRLAKIIKGCREIPGKELFEFIDDNGMVHNIDSGMVNGFIQTLTGGDFTAKDFRTWTGSVQALLALKEIGDYENETDLKQKLPLMFEQVAGQLGNTKAVCKKYYVHPAITELYEKKKLDKFISGMGVQNNGSSNGLSTQEKVLMKILKKIS